MNVYVGGWSLKPERDNQVSTPVAGNLHDGVLDLSFEPSGRAGETLYRDAGLPGAYEPGKPWRRLPLPHPLRDYWLKASPDLDGYAGTQEPES